LHVECVGGGGPLDRLARVPRRGIEVSTDSTDLGPNLALLVGTPVDQPAWIASAFFH